MILRVKTFVKKKEKVGEMKEKTQLTTKIQMKCKKLLITEGVTKEII